MRPRFPRKVAYNRALLYGEGIDDQTWMQYLRKIYAPRKPGIDFGNAHGGDPKHLVEQIPKHRGFNECWKKLALFDDDRGGVEDARRRLNRMGVDCVISKQCLELEMLKLCDGVTEGQMSRARRSSKEAKKVLKEVCGCECSMEDFERCFPKELLDRKRAGSAWLDTLIEYIEKC